MARLVYSLSVLLAVAAAAYKLWLQPILVIHGLARIPTFSFLLATTPPFYTEIVLHPPTGVLYLACSSPESRAHWTPALAQFNASGPDEDYLATYDPSTGVLNRLHSPLPGLSVHGLDVVPSAADPSELFIYAVNHRKPEDRQSAATIGADSTVEIFKTTIGSTVLTHLHTLRDPVIITPNDVLGNPDGQSLFFTNDHSTKTGLIRLLSLVGLEWGSVGYCDVKAGCKFAIRNMNGANGIARGPNNDTIFVSNSIGSGISVLERQSDNALLKTHSIPTDGVLWAAGIPSTLAIAKHIANPSLRAPSSAHSVARNTGPGSFYGDKFKVFEDDGTLASGTTSVVHDVQRQRLFLHGIASPHLTVCIL
ncbi:hypothetical protein FB451DRAFT_1386494 [Mycena latifolia]|nr:hypothetical protein FB451DRAFT_1386494 [Mycena latifolia]